MEFVFTGCDGAAGEACPVWPGHPMTAHWSMPDPVTATGTEAERRYAFAEAYRHLSNRIGIFINLPVHSIAALALQEQLDDRGQPAVGPAAARQWSGAPAEAGTATGRERVCTDG